MPDHVHVPGKINGTAITDGVPAGCPVCGPGFPLKLADAAYASLYMWLFVAQTAISTASITPVHVVVVGLFYGLFCDSLGYETHSESSAEPN